MTLGTRIKFLRKEANITQSELAKKLNLSFGTISKYEKDEISIPSETLLKIANIFDVTTDYLLGRTNTPNTIDEPIAIAASTKDGIDLSDVCDEDKKTIMEFIKFAKSKNKKD